MATPSRPGVFVEEHLNLSNAIQSPSAGLAAFVAAHSRGPLTPTLVQNFSEFKRLYGDFAAGADLSHAVFQFISNGGRACYVLRVAANDAVTATRTIQDEAGTPVNTLKVDAANPGAWGNQIYVGIEDVGTARFNLIVYYGGTASVNIVERWADLSMDDADDRFVETIINSVTAGSTYITVTDLDSATAAPQDRPAAGSPVALATGADGTAVDASDVADAATTTLGTVTRGFTLNLPGVTDTVALNSVISYAETRGDVFVVADPPKGSDVAAAVSAAQALTASSYAALYYPWLVVSDPSVRSSTATRVVPPGPSVLGKIAQVDAARGVYKAPAGLTARLSNVVAMETDLSNPNLDTLHAAHVNPIKYQVGTGFHLAGARTLEIGLSSKYVPVRRTLNYLKEALTDGLLWALHEPNDALLWEGIRVETAAFLAAFWREGGLAGSSADQAFFVKCDAEINTPAVVDAGEVRVEIGVAVQRPAEFVVIKIGQWEGGQTATEVVA